MFCLVHHHVSSAPTNSIGYNPFPYLGNIDKFDYPTAILRLLGI